MKLIKIKINIQIKIIFRLNRREVFPGGERSDYVQSPQRSAQLSPELALAVCYLRENTPAQRKHRAFSVEEQIPLKNGISAVPKAAFFPGYAARDILK